MVCSREMVWKKGWMGLGSRTVFGFLAFVLLITATVPRCRAQTWNEFFKQKKTQIKYLGEQIAALQVYIGYAKKGYQIVDGGISAIRDITGGEFRLHELFISSLKQVSPAIRDDARIAEIVLLQVAILKAFSQVKKSDLLSAENMAYITLVSEAVIRSCYADLEELLLVITSGRLEMSDDERLLRLERIYENMVDKSAFVQDFVGNANLLVRQRQQEQHSLETMIRMFYHKE